MRPSHLLLFLWNHGHQKGNPLIVSLFGAHGSFARQPEKEKASRRFNCKIFFAFKRGSHWAINRESLFLSTKVALKTALKGNQLRKPRRN